MAYFLTIRLVKQFLNIFVKRTNGISNIPKKGKFIVALNHASLLDDIIAPANIGCYIRKKLHNYVNSRFFNNYFLGKFLYWVGSIPVDLKKTEQSKKINEKAFKLALAYLKKNEPVGIFPEGHRSLDGKLQKAKTGVARLALEAKVPVLPIGIIDSHKILPKGKVVPKLKKCVIVNIGKPMHFEKYYNKITKKNLILVTRKVMKEIARLSNKKYEY